MTGPHRSRRRVRLCAETLGEVDFLLAQDIQPRAVAADALLAIGGCGPGCGLRRYRCAIGRSERAAAITSPRLEPVRAR